jgi:hypothetical protein
MSAKFLKLTPAKLAKAAIVPQVVDNQWVPKKLLNRMISKKKELKQVKQTQKKYIRKEWRRALVYGEQVVVNRAYILNNQIIVDDYDDKINREHFKTLLNDRVIIPYLFSEEGPDQKPKFDIGKKKWETWLEILKETYPACVRLKWEDQKTDFEKMSSAFHRYIKGLDTPGMPESLASYLELPQSHLPAFKERVFEVVDYVTRVGRDGNYVTRNMMYANFVTAPDSAVDDGKYGNGLFSGELKQVFDLKYNVNLPDALGRYALTPEDSLPRSALGDLDEALRSTVITEKNISNIISALRQLVFEKVAKGLYINSLGSLSLGDVVEIRKMDEWKIYTQSVHNLLKNPLKFSDRSNDLYIRFEALNRAISKYRERKFTEKWEPWVKFTLGVGLSAIEIWINPANTTDKFLTKIGSDFVATGFAPFLMRMTVTAMNKKNNADLDMSIDFMRGTINNAGEAWEEITRKLAETKGFKKLDKSLSKEDESNQSIPENLE